MHDVGHGNAFRLPLIGGWYPIAVGGISGDIILGNTITATEDFLDY